MTLTLELPQELALDLSAEAKRQGLPLAEYVLRLLEQRRRVEQAPRTGAEIVAFWRREGVLGSRPDIADSPAYARELRRQAERRQEASEARRRAVC